MVHHNMSSWRRRFENLPGKTGKTCQFDGSNHKYILFWLGHNLRKKHTSSCIVKFSIHLSRERKFALSSLAKIQKEHFSRQTSTFLCSPGIKLMSLKTGLAIITSFAASFECVDTPECFSDCPIVRFILKMLN